MRSSGTKKNTDIDTTRARRNSRTRESQQSLELAGELGNNYATLPPAQSARKTKKRVQRRSKEMHARREEREREKQSVLIKRRVEKRKAEAFARLKRERAEKVEALKRRVEKRKKDLLQEEAISVERARLLFHERTGQERSLGKKAFVELCAFALELDQKVMKKRKRHLEKAFVTADKNSAGNMEEAEFLRIFLLIRQDKLEGFS